MNIDSPNEDNRRQNSSGIDKRHVLDSCISEATKKSYSSCIKGISTWLRKTQYDPERFFQNASSEINLAEFTPSLFEDFLLYKTNNSSVKTITLCSYRSAVKDLYRKEQKDLPSSYEKNLKPFFSGLKRIEAGGMQNGLARESGKLALPYSIYQSLCVSTIKILDGGFAHLFLLTQWNLMCRSASVENLSMSHLTSADDSIGCILHKSKTNQEGNGPKDPRHIYANPLSPSTCWVLSLGMYLACNPLLCYGSLFPGSNQKNRFCKILEKCLKLNEMGKSYGTHSVRKGVATYACSGSTGGPSIVSVCLRCGWSLGNVQDRYFRYEAAGDQYLGRVVAGLPINSSDFSILPPHFADQENPIMTHCIEEMFPVLQSICHLNPILKLCLGSLVHHESFLRDILPSKHPVLCTYIFRNLKCFEELKKLVVIRNSPWMQKTGIPPHVEIYNQLEKSHESIKSIPKIVIDGVSTIIEEKGVAAGNITKELLQQTIQESLSLFRGHADVEALSVRETVSNGNIHTWGNKIHLLPENFEFPSVDLLGAWKLWWFGNEISQIPPFRKINTVDLSTRKKRNLYSEWSIMMNKIIDQLMKDGTEIPINMTELQSLALFRKGTDSLFEKIQHKTARKSQIKMTTALRLLRESNTTNARQRRPYKSRCGKAKSKQ